jgi:hypothetical protein
MHRSNHRESHFVGVVAALAIVITSVVSTTAQDKPKSGLVVDAAAKRITIDCVVAPRKLENLNEIYPIEVVATHPAPKGKKAHETVVTFDVPPSQVHQALIGLGLKPGTPAKGEGAKAAGPEVKVSLEVPGPGGLAKKVAIEKVLVDRKTGKPLPPLKWFFTGSVMTQPDPNKPDKVFGADLSGTLIALFPVTDETVLQTNLTMKDEPLIKLETAKDVLPAVGMPIKLVIEAK